MKAAAWVMAAVVGLGVAGCTSTTSEREVSGEWFGRAKSSSFYAALAQKGTAVIGKVCERPDKDCMTVSEGTFNWPALSFKFSFESCSGGAAPPCPAVIVSTSGTMSADGDTMAITYTRSDNARSETLTLTRCAQAQCADQIAGPKPDGGSPGDGGVTPGQPTSLAAAAVGAWASRGSSCAGGTDWEGAFGMCPGGRIRGAGTMGNTTELVCGSYTVSARVYDNCNDKYGCFDKIKAVVKHTLILGGQSDVKHDVALDLYLYDNKNMIRTARCLDGTEGYLQYEKIDADVADDFCVSSACPAPSGSTPGSYGQCSGDCDCGECWYCEKGTCRYGGKGPYGCYRGCQF